MEQQDIFTKTVCIPSWVAVLALISFGALSMLSVVFTVLLARSTPQTTLNDMLGCLPGTQATLKTENIGERQDNVVAKCMNISKD